MVPPYSQLFALTVRPRYEIAQPIKVVLLWMRLRLRFRDLIGSLFIQKLELSGLELYNKQALLRQLP